jgi:hypothetical protein
MQPEFQADIMKKTAIVQSNYIPWKGYFDMINLADEFILLDEVDYTVRDWRNRNEIKVATGSIWLTIPVQRQRGVRQTINETVISNPDWRRQHWETIRRNYTKAAYFKEYGPLIEELYRSSDSNMLSEVNYNFLCGICRILGITTPITRSKDYGVTPGKTSRLVDLCKKAGASVYISGPAAADYLEKSEFQAEGIGVEWMNYSGYKPYTQLYGDFIHEVSVIDLILNEGPNAADYMISMS